MIHCTLCQHDKPRDEFADSAVHKETSGQCRSCMTLYREAVRLGVRDPAQHVRNALPPIECSVCGETRPTREFAPYAPVATCRSCWDGGRQGVPGAGQRERKNQVMRKLRAATPAEDKAKAQAALRAGMRKDKCAICREPIEGQGICTHCEGHVVALGGLDGLKQAVRAVRYLEGQ